MFQWVAVAFYIPQVALVITMMMGFGGARLEWRAPNACVVKRGFVLGCAVLRVVLSLGGKLVSR